MKKSFFYLLVCFCFVSCGGQESDSYADIKKMNIFDARYLFISGSGAGASEVVTNEVGGFAKLFKITVDGYIEEVTYEDENGNPVVTSEGPAGIYNIDEEYVVVTFGGDSYLTSSYLVRKSDGAVYKLGGNDLESPNAIGPISDMNNSPFINASPLYSDKYGDVYFYSTACQDYNSSYVPEYRTVYKLMNLGLNPQVQQILPETDNVDKFVVNKEGDVFYSGYLTETYNDRFYRVRKTNESLENTTDYYTSWRADNGDVYYCDDKQIKKIFVDSGFNIVEENYGSPLSESIYNWMGSSYLLNFSDKTLIIQPGNLSVFEVYNTTDTPIVESHSAILSSISKVAWSLDFYYLAGKDTSNKGVIKKCAKTDHSCSDLLIPGQYDVYFIAVSDTNEVTFNALRMSDGAKIIAKVSSYGNVTLIDSSLNTQITMLERIL